MKNTVDWMNFEGFYYNGPDTLCKALKSVFLFLMNLPKVKSWVILDWYSNSS